MFGSTQFKVPLKLVAALLAIIGIVFCFWAINTKVPEIEAKTNKLKAENESLQLQCDNLNELKKNMEHYLGEIERLNSETDKLLTEFPTFMYLEDKILYADTLLKTDLKGYNLSNFGYGQSTYIMSVNYGTSETAASNLLELYSVGLNGAYQDLTYVQIKEILDYALTAPQRFVVKEITMTYSDKTGYLVGELDFSTYFIPGQPTPYEFPQHVVDGLGESTRVDDLFGARTTPTNSTNN